MGLGRDWIRQMPSEHLSSLLSEWDFLVPHWAQHAKVNAGDLRVGKKRAVVALRMTMSKSPDRFQTELATAAMVFAHGDGDRVDEQVNDAEHMAQSLCELFGPQIGSHLIRLVAESSTIVSEEVALRVEELIELGAAAGKSKPEVDGEPLDPQASAFEESTGDPIGERPSEMSIDTGTWTVTDAALQLHEANELLAGSVVLTAALRAAADDVSAGRALRTQTLSEDLEDWSARAARLLPEGGSIEQLIGSLEQEVQRQEDLAAAEEGLAARRRELGELVAGATALEEQNLGRLVPGMLEPHGFSTAAEVRAALAELGSGGNAAAPVGPYLEPAHDPGSDPAGVDESGREPLPSEVQPAPEPGPHPGPGPKHEDGVQLSTEPGPAAESKSQSKSEPDAEDADERGDADGAGATAKSDFGSEVTSDSDPGGDPAPETPVPEASAEVVRAVLTVVPPAKTERRGSEVSDGGTEPGLPGDPWAEPEVPLIARLITEGREHLAVLLSDHDEPGSPRTRALRFLTAAFNTRTDSIQTQLPDLVLESHEVQALGSDDARLLLAGGVRLALDLGYSPIGSLDALRERCAFSDDPTGSLMDVAVELSRKGFRRAATPAAASATAEPNDWRQLSGDAAGLLDTLAIRRLSLQRSSKIVHYLARRNQPLGAALSDLVALADAADAGRLSDEAAWERIADRARSWSKPSNRDRLIDEATQALSSPKQRRQAIVADARKGMIDAVEEVVSLIETALAMRARKLLPPPAKEHDAAMLAQALSTVTSSPVASAGDAAMQRLLEWLRDGDTAPLSSDSLDRQLIPALGPLFELPHDSDDVPVRAATRVELAQLVHGRDAMLTVRGYLAVGNRRAADACILAAGLPRTDALGDELLEAGRTAQHVHAKAVIGADRVVARLRALSDDEHARSLALRIEEHRTPVPDRIDLSLLPLADIEEEAVKRIGEVRSALQERVRGLVDSGSAARINALIEGEDEPLAVEYLTLAEAGTELPTLSPPPADDFAGFFPAVVEIAARATTGRSAIDDVRAHLGADAGPTNRALVQGMKAWRDLDAHRRGGAQEAFLDRLNSVLRLLGLVPGRSPRNLKGRGSTPAFEVAATPIDRSYVPSLGTQAHGRYDVTLVWDKTSPSRLFSIIDEDRRTRANIILYFGTLTTKQRLELRRLTTRAGSEFSPVVIDHAVIGWLSTLDEPGWRQTQRVTLPFTTLNPYTPFAGGEVPDEVFVGREAERRDIVDPTGSMFVYGGRQLGKSALLRRVEREFMGRRAGSSQGGGHDGRIALYLDLRSASLGEAAPPESLWPTLAPYLVKLGVISDDGRRSWTAESLPAAIQDWLEADETRQFLLLLDEADNFLTSDSRNVAANGLGGFPTLQRLKGLMERSGRRFKPVFAGLHQVQRFHDLPNTPVAHGGRDILVGPLNPVDARQLVRDPLYALGYEFETDETMWRLLLFTNYQASLVQIICFQIVTHMRRKPLPTGGGRVVITNRDVDEVYAKPDVRDLIAARFRWTINLDPRYLVIAMVTAWRSFDGAPGETFEAADLQDECAGFWPQGFDQRVLPRAEFGRYLEEMKGLGVLHGQGGAYGLRSPSIRGLLGTRESIESELLEVADTLDVEQGYNPSLNRRMLVQTQRRGAERRSPLCDADLGRLLGRAHVVVGTPALGVDRVSEALRLVAEERGREFTEVDVSGLPDVLRRRRSSVHLVDLRATETDLAERLAAAHRANMTVVLVTHPGAIGGVDMEDSRVLTLRRWSLEALQAWQETPFSTPVLRQEVMRFTGGWPDLVERAAFRVSQGAAPAAAILAVGDELADVEKARSFLGSTGVRLDVATRWAELSGVTGTDGRTESIPVSLDDLDDAGFSAPARDLIAELQVRGAVEETDDGWVLERVVTDAALTLTS